MLFVNRFGSSSSSYNRLARFRKTRQRACYDRVFTHIREICVNLWFAFMMPPIVDNWAVGVSGFDPFAGYSGDASRGYTGDSSDAAINSGIQGALGLASGALRQSQAAGAQKAAQEKAINARWEQIVRQALSIFTAVSVKLPHITPADLAAAQGAYDALAQFVAQYPTEYVLQQWQSSAYQGAAIADLQKYQAALSTGSTSGVASSSSSQLATVAGASSLGSLGDIVAAVESNPILALVGVVAALLVGKVLLK